LKKLSFGKKISNCFLMTLSDTQHGVMLGMGIGATISVVGVGAALGQALPSWATQRLVPAKPSSVDQDIARALRWNLLIALPLISSIGRLASFRFFSPDDIDAAASKRAPSKDVNIYQAVITNTLEQALVSVGTQLAWSASMPRETQTMVPLANMFFFAGRILFVLGYEHGAAYRSAGFALTFYPSVLMAVSLVVHNMGFLY